MSMQIYLAKSGRQTGPFSIEEVEGFLEARTIELEDSAWHEGLAEWKTLQVVMDALPPKSTPPPIPLAKVQAALKSDAMFLYISPVRLAVMSIVSLGLFDAYWIYRNWRYFKERDNLGIKPFWRGIFGIFYIYSLLDSIVLDSAANKRVPATYNTTVLAGGWIVLHSLGNVMGRMEDTSMNLVGLVVSAPTFLFLLPVQKHINAVNESLSPPPAFYPFSKGHVVCLVFGIVVWLLILIGLLPESIF